MLQSPLDLLPFAGDIRGGGLQYLGQLLPEIPPPLSEQGFGIHIFGNVIAQTKCTSLVYPSFKLLPFGAEVSIPQVPASGLVLLSLWSLPPAFAAAIVHYTLSPQASLQALAVELFAKIPCHLGVFLLQVSFMALSELLFPGYCSPFLKLILMQLCHRL